MFKKVVVSITILFFFCVTGISIAQQPAPAKPSSAVKLGFVDIQKALNSCTAGKAAAAKLNKELEDAKKKYETQGQALMKEKETLERQEAVLNEDVFKDKVRNFQSKFRDWDRFRKDIETDIRQQHNEMVDKISKELIELTEQMGKEGNYTLIVERSLVPYINPAQASTRGCCRRISSIASRKARDADSPAIRRR